MISPPVVTTTTPFMWQLTPRFSLPSRFQRFDVNGDGVLDEAEKVIGRRIMAEVFLENHEHHIHLYGQGLTRKVRRGRTCSPDEVRPWNPGYLSRQAQFMTVIMLFCDRRASFGRAGYRLGDVAFSPFFALCTFF